ncbi:hypothetical protein F5B21DRAFT_486613 [Xylaria acuta]|nr:hypothetical protein F5B21DRAFT_486613 [Xylaria acuta]
MPGVIQEPLAGCIKWLPRKESLMPADPNIEEGCCNHPVVILSTRPQIGKVQILIITSFGGDDLETKYPTQALARLDHLPIAPSRAHPDNGVLLVLKDPSDKMRKKSYVKMRNRYSILLCSLEPYNRLGPEIFLSKKSYHTLIKHTKFVEPQDAPVLYGLAHTRTPRSSPYGQDLERANGIRRNRAVEDVTFLPGYYTGVTEYDRTSRPNLNSHTGNNYSVRPIPSITSYRAERQPLFATREEYLPRSYGSYTPLPTTHPIPPSDGSGSSGPWKSIKVLIGIFLASLISYGLYYGGRSYWAVVLGTHPRVLTTKAFESVGGIAKSIWVSFLSMYDRAGEYGVNGVKNGFM